MKTANSLELSLEKIGSYAKEVFLSAYLPVILALPLGMGLDFVLDYLRWPLATRIMGEPFFIPPMGIAIIVPFSILNRTRRQPSTLVWIPIAIILVWNLFTWDRYPGQIYYWKDVWNNFFGSDCGSSECLNEWFVTAPFYCSVVYSVVAVIFRYRKVSRYSNEPVTAL